MQNAFEYARHIGPIFGSEKISFLLYSLVRMRRPDYLVELGCGTGSTAFCMAEALRENGNGRLLTVDNEQAWPEIAARLPLVDLGLGESVSMSQFIGAFSDRFSLSDRLTYHKSDLPPFPTPKEPLDLLFVDYNHRPENITRVLASYLPVMARSSVIIFDSAATYFPTYQLLENLDTAFGGGRVPEMLLRDQSAERRQAVVDLVRRSRIKILHFVEKDKTEQNSASAMFIEPYDLVPAGDVVMRMT